MRAQSSSAAVSDFAKSFDFAIATHIGQRRQENQDAFGMVVQESSASFWVADGMGGAHGGAQASALSVRILENALRRESAESIEDRVRYAINEASEEIYYFGQQNPSLEGMGTTVSGFVLTLDKVLLFNVGDSRVYRVRGDSIAQLTTDHTLIGELLNTGALTEEQAKASPVSHMLTRSVGPSPKVEIDCFTLDHPPMRGDIYLICSDGLYNQLSGAEIGYIVGEYNLNDALEHLVSLANMRGGTDNITGLLVECGEAFPELTEHVVVPQENTAKSKHKIVQIDLAEAAAAASFSRVKEEVDISAEILWSAQKGKRPVESSHPADLVHEQIKIKLRKGLFSRLTLIQRAIFVMAIVCVLTVALSLGLKWMKDAEAARAREREANSRRIVDFSDQSQEPRASLLDEQESPEQIAERKALLSRLNVGAPEISEEEKNVLRKKRLHETVKHYDAQIKRLALSDDPEFPDFRTDASTRKETLEGRIVSVEKAVQKMDGSLVQWRRRLREVQELDTVNLVSELATISPELKEKKEQFEKTSWEYLKELENKGLDPENKEIQERIGLLVDERNRQLKDLKESSIRFIEAKIGSEARERGLLLIEHGELLEDEKLLKEDFEYIDVRLSGDEQRRTALDASLKRRREGASQELLELEKLPGETPSAP